MHAISVLRGPSDTIRKRRAVTFAAAAALFAAVIAAVTIGARVVHASPPAATAPVASGRTAVDASPGRDPSVPSAQAVFEGQTKVAPDEMTATF